MRLKNTAEVVIKDTVAEAVEKNEFYGYAREVSESPFVNEILSEIITFGAVSLASGGVGLVLARMGVRKKRMDFLHSEANSSLVCTDYAGDKLDFKEGLLTVFIFKFTFLSYR